MAQKGKSNFMFLKWKDKRDVCVLSTNCSPSEPDVTITRLGTGGAQTEVQKPKVITVYNENMGGVDLSDQLRVKRLSKKRGNPTTG